MTDKCIDCSDVLTELEREYYEFRCELCESAMYHRIQDWRGGKSDLQLDVMFSRKENHSVH